MNGSLCLPVLDNIRIICEILKKHWIFVYFDYMVLYYSTPPPSCFHYTKGQSAMMAGNMCLCGSSSHPLLALYSSPPSILAAAVRRGRELVLLPCTLGHVVLRGDCCTCGMDKQKYRSQ